MAMFPDFHHHFIDCVGRIRRFVQFRQRKVINAAFEQTVKILQRLLLALADALQ